MLGVDITPNYELVARAICRQIAQVSFGKDEKKIQKYVDTNWNQNNLPSKIENSYKEFCLRQYSHA